MSLLPQLKVQRPSGSVGDADIFRSQQYGPLLGIDVIDGKDE